MANYDYSSGFQEKILALTWREPSFFTIYKDCLKPQYFESELHIDMARILFDYYERYEMAPTLDVMMEEVRVLCQNSKIKKEKQADYEKAVGNLVNADLSDSAYVKDKVVDFGRKQALTEAILKSVDDLKSAKDFSIIETRIKEANQVGQNIGDFGTFYFQTVDERLKEYDVRDTEKIATGIDLLDKVMLGGLGRGELGIVIAPPGTGKTLSLINIGSAAKMQGKNVAHFSLEMNETRVSQRYDSTFTDKPFQYIKDNKDKVSKALGMLAKAREGELVIKSYPTRTCSVDMIKSYLTKIKISHNFVPDIIIIDYPDLLRPTNAYKERRTELEVLYEEIRGLGQEFDCAVWGASQTNRGALEKKVVTIADLAESFGKAAVADFMIAISQTKEEKKNDELRYYVAKSRNGESDYTVHCDVYYDRMKVRSNSERQMAFEMADDEEDSGASSEARKKRMEKEIREKQKSENSVANEIKNMVKGENAG